MLYQKHCPSTQVKTISSHRASLNFQAHWNFCSHSVSIKRDRLLISYLLSCPMNTALHYLLTLSSVLPASICAQLFCKLPISVPEHINATHSLCRENEKWKCGRECLGMAHISVFYLARGILWERRRPDSTLPAEGIRVSLVDSSFQVQEVTVHSTVSRKPRSLCPADIHFYQHVGISERVLIM